MKVTSPQEAFSTQPSTAAGDLRTASPSGARTATKTGATSRPRTLSGIATSNAAMPLSFQLAELEKGRKQIREEEEQMAREAV